MLTCNAARHRVLHGITPLRHVTFREYARTSAAEVQRSLAEMLTPWTMGHGRLSVGASLNRARLVVFPAFGSVQRRSREKNARMRLPDAGD